MQHLNLYSQLDRKSEPLFSGRQQTGIVTAVLVLMLVAYAWLSFSTGKLQVTSDQLEREQGRLEATLTELRERKARLERESTLDSELAMLKDEIQFIRSMLNNIDPGSTVLATGFAEHLQGLGRQHINGMWFTEIQLQQGGKQLALTGQTRKPEIVPRYIQNLGREPVFEGHQFRVFRMHVPETEKQLLEFELRANAVANSSGGDR